MKRVLALLLVLLLLVPVIAVAETARDLVPDPSLWGVSRTKFKNEFNVSFTEIEANGYKCLTETGLTVDYYPMDAYYEFASQEGTYNGLSRVLYLLDVQSKVSDSSLNTCYSDLYADMQGVAGEPNSATKTSAIWYYDDLTLEMNIGKYKAFNGSNNKTVAIIFSEPGYVAEASAGSSSGRSSSSGSTGTGRASTMTVTATATCSDYNHVGNSWKQAFYINGKRVKETSEISLKAGEEVTVKATITDEDATPDSGTNEKSYVVTRDDITKGFTVTFTVNVEETGGRYAGNKAKWNVRFKFQ